MNAANSYSSHNQDSFFVAGFK